MWAKLSGTLSYFLNEFILTHKCNTVLSLQHTKNFSRHTSGIRTKQVPIYNLPTAMFESFRADNVKIKQRANVFARTPGGNCCKHIFCLKLIIIKQITPILQNVSCIDCQADNVQQASFRSVMLVGFVTTRFRSVMMVGFVSTRFRSVMVEGFVTPRFRSVMMVVFVTPQLWW